MSAEALALSGSSRRRQTGVVRQSVVIAADGRPFRALDIRLMDGPHLRLLPDRGLDIAECWMAGRPVHWAAPCDEGPSSPDLAGHEWEDRFFGGLLSTCGLANVGEPAEGHGLHGRFNHLPATDLRLDWTDRPGGSDLRVQGMLREVTADGADFRVSRTITAGSGHGRITVTDSVTNHGPAEAPAPILYHLNFGWPLTGEDCTVQLPGLTASLPEFGDPADLPGGWRQPGGAAGAAAPVTVEHLLEAGLATGEARIASAAAGLEVRITWDRAALPRVLQWIDMRPGRGVVAIEPSNCSTRGRAHDRAEGRLPMLAAGATRQTGVTIEIAAPSRAPGGSARE